MKNKLVLAGLCLLLIVLPFILPMCLLRTEVPSTVFGFTGALIGILARWVYEKVKK